MGSRNRSEDKAGYRYLTVPSELRVVEDFLKCRGNLLDTCTRRVAHYLLKKRGIQPVACNTHDTHIKQADHNFPEILRRSQLVVNRCGN